MSKHNKRKNFNEAADVSDAELEADDAVAVAEEEAEVEAQPEAAAKPNAKKPKKAKKKDKKPNIFVRMWRKIKEVFSELKRVTWPSFKTVVKQTCIVLLVVAFFLVIIWGVDTLLSLLYNLL